MASLEEAPIKDAKIDKVMPFNQSDAEIEAPDMFQLTFIKSSFLSSLFDVLTVIASGRNDENLERAMNFEFLRTSTIDLYSEIQKKIQKLVLSIGGSIICFYFSLDL